MAASFLPVWFIGNAVDASAVLITASLGAFIAFGMRLFNFGGEGQIYTGGVAASAVILLFQPVAAHLSGGVSALVLVLAAAASLVVGGALGAVSGALKQRFHADELLTTYLLSASLVPLCDALVTGLFRDQSGNLLASAKFAPALTLTRILPPSNLSLSFVGALALVAVFYVYLTKTGAGYRFSVAGAAPGFAAYGGIKAAAYTIPALVVSGALHGLAGFFFCAGTAGRLHIGFSGGIGWDAIAVALLVRKKPLLLIPAALCFCALLSTAESALLLRGLKLETKRFIEALAIFIAASIRLRGNNRV
ncbi:MAG: ABC transporter permease [Spirochaetaceae bacterium]|nr:ABC transporter permease [Spirochaetaceae bacterium]